MFAVDVCDLPDTGGSTFVLIAGLFLLVAGVIVARWVRQSAGRLSVVVAPLVLLGGFVLAPQAVDPCAPATTTVASATTTVASATTIVPSATTIVPSATTTVAPATTTTTTSTTTIALTCANGGSCAVGVIGPGGGVVFYANSSGFACGPTLTSTCKYLESAPITGVGAWTDAQYYWTGSLAYGSAIGSAAQGTAIGTGYKNTLAMVSQDSTASRAGTASRGFGGPNNRTDWYLPSKDELNALITNVGVTGVGPLNPGFYASSTEASASDAWLQANSSQQSLAKSNQPYVRPIRAF